FLPACGTKWQKCPPSGRNSPVSLISRGTAFGRRASAVVGERLHQIHNALAHLRIGDLHEGPVELETIGGGQEIGDVTGLAVFCETTCRAGGAAAGTAFEKEGNRCVENRRDRLQAARPDAVGALFIFLYLLECDAQAFAKL